MKKYLESHPEKTSSYDNYIKLCEKYNSVNKVKKSIVFYKGRYTGKGWFSLVFEHEIPKRDGHTIFLDDCHIIDGKLKLGNCTFEG